MRAVMTMLSSPIKATAACTSKGMPTLPNARLYRPICVGNAKAQPNARPQASLSPDCAARTQINSATEILAMASPADAINAQSGLRKRHSTPPTSPITVAASSVFLPKRSRLWADSHWLIHQLPITAHTGPIKTCAVRIGAAGIDHNAAAAAPNKPLSNAKNKKLPAR